MSRLKTAVTVRSALSDTMHSPVPEHAPDQRFSVEPADGLALSVTASPKSNVCEHVEPQSMPTGRLVTDPMPVPDLVTVSVCGAT